MCKKLVEKGKVYYYCSKSFLLLKYWFQIIKSDNAVANFELILSSEIYIVEVIAKQTQSENVPLISLIQNTVPFEYVVFSNNKIMHNIKMYFQLL